MDVEPLLQNREQVAAGKVMIRALDAIAKAGAGERGLPKLAIMRADQKRCYLDLRTDGSAIMHNRRDAWAIHRAAASLRFEFPAATFGTSQRSRRMEAIVPHIPLDIRPKRGLQNYHVLFEAIWHREVPIDPMLLRRVGTSGDLWIVLHVWELTEIERAVLAGHIEEQRQ